jgi:putative flippase GtrA
MATNPVNSLPPNSRYEAVKRFLNAYETVFQLWKFACVGAIATLIQFGILIFLVQLFGVAPVAASVAGYMVGACFNYYLNYKITFKATTNHKKTALMFGVTTGVGLFLNAVVMSFCLNTLHAKYIYAQVAATGCVFVWNFTLNKLWTFRPAAERQEDGSSADEPESLKGSVCRK